MTGLRAGGDDYLAKPYAFSELLARVEVLARRRKPGEAETILRVGDLELDRLSHTVRRATSPIALQPREFPPARISHEACGAGRDADHAARECLDYHFDPQTNVIDVHISACASKVDKGYPDQLVHTVRGAGYMIRDGAR